MSEFDLIRRLQSRLSASQSSCTYPASVGIGDDAAVLSPEKNKQLVVSTDTLVSGVHFPLKTPPSDIGFKSLAVNLSDLAAMGAEPAWYFLALTLPESNEQWLDEFAAGLAELSQAAGIQLAGGDTTSGPLAITITAMGFVSQGQALLRSHAKPDDLLVVSGVPGLAALGLMQIQCDQEMDMETRAAFTRPQPRLCLGSHLVGNASSCIDISDGLLADLSHICKASQVGAELWLDRLPRADSLQALDPEQRWSLQLSGGDDYELCFTLPAHLEPELASMSAACNVGLSIVGRMTANAGIHCLKPDGSAFQPLRKGFEHFSETAEF
jgi:thiamine-monophosphate kinase